MSAYKTTKYNVVDRNINVFIYFGSRESLDYAFSNFVRQMATLIVVFWSAGRSWKNDSNYEQCTQPAKLQCTFYSTCIIYKCDRGPRNTIRRSEGWRRVMQAAQTVLRPGRSGFRILIWAGYFSVLQTVQTGSGDLPSLVSSGQGCLLTTRVELSRVESNRIGMQIHWRCTSTDMSPIKSARIQQVFSTL